MPDREPLVEPKTNRSRTEVGRTAFQLLRSHDVVAATRGESDYDVLFFTTDRRPGDDLSPVLEPKTNRPRAEVGRAVFNFLKTHDEVWIGGGESEYDVQIYVAE